MSQDRNIWDTSGNLIWPSIRWNNFFWRFNLIDVLLMISHGWFFCPRRSYILYGHFGHMSGSKYLVQRFFPGRFLGNPLQCGVCGGLILQFIIKINLPKFCISNQWVAMVHYTGHVYLLLYTNTDRYRQLYTYGFAHK